MNKPHANKLRQLVGLWHKQNGHCKWCFRRMIFPTGEPPVKGVPPLNMSCTLDHLDCRLSPDRGRHPYGDKRRVASCWICNNRRGAMQEAQLTREEFDRRCHNRHPWKKWYEL